MICSHCHSCPTELVILKSGKCHRCPSCNYIEPYKGPEPKFGISDNQNTNPGKHLKEKK